MIPHLKEKIDILSQSINRTQHEEEILSLLLELEKSYNLIHIWEKRYDNMRILKESLERQINNDYPQDETN